MRTGRDGTEDQEEMKGGADPRGSAPLVIVGTAIHPATWTRPTIFMG
jgi:hypothetical protein